MYSFFSITITITYIQTVGLLLRLCSQLFGTGKVVILDSGFSVLQALIELRKQGVFAAAVAKKRRYWPKYVLGSLIDKKMKDKNVGEVDACKGYLDGIPYHIFSLKEPEYNMKMMSTYGAGIQDQNYRQNSRTYLKDGKTVTTKFYYTDIYSNHFQYRHAVDDNNNLRHKLPSIEETWITAHWMNREFTFILALSEVNSFLAMRFFIWKNKSSITLHQFRHKLAMQLIHNEEYESEMLGHVTEKRGIKECVPLNM